MKKKSKPALTANHIIDFASYIMNSVESGLAVEQSLHAMTPYLESPLKESVRVCTAQLSLGHTRTEALCEVANQHMDSHLHRILKIIMYSYETGGNMVTGIDRILQGLQKNPKLSKATHKLNVKEFERMPSNVEATTSKPVPPVTGLLLVEKKYLERQKFWKFIDLAVKSRANILLVGVPSKERDAVQTLLEKKCTQTLHLDTKNSIQFLTAAAEKFSLLGVVDANNARDAVHIIELYSVALGSTPALARHGISNHFKFIISLADLGAYNYISKVTELQGLSGENVVQQDIFEAKLDGFNKDRQPLGFYRPLGMIPAIVTDWNREGIHFPASLFTTD